MTSVAAWADRRLSGPHGGCRVTGITSAACSGCGPDRSTDERGGRIAECFRAQTPSRSIFTASRSTWCGASNAPNTCSISRGSSAARPSWLRPGGRIAICAWLAGSDMTVSDRDQQVHDVCEGFLCPSLGTAADYRGWMEDAGLVCRSYDDWTDRVAQTWEICPGWGRESGHA